MNKIEDHFLTESLFIPNKGVPVVIVGTPMMPGDLLTILEEHHERVNAPPTSLNRATVVQRCGFRIRP